MTTKVFLPDNLKTGTFAIGWKQRNLYYISHLVEAIDGDDEASLIARFFTKDQQQSLKLDPDLLYIETENGTPTRIYDFEWNELESFVIYFTPPKVGSLQFYSLKPLILDLRKEEEHDVLYQKLLGDHAESKEDLDSKSLEELLTKLNSDKHLKPRMTKRMADYFLSTILPLIQLFLTRLNYLLQHFQRIILRSNLLKYSLTAEQLNTRIEQFNFWPRQYHKWLKLESKFTCTAQAQYIGFFNTVWLIINDIIIGFALKRVLVENSVEIAKGIEVLLLNSIKELNQIILWLMKWPAGLKLNFELAYFLSTLFQWILYSWVTILNFIFLHLPTVLYVIGICGVFGATFSISMLSDLATLTSLHIRLLYIISARIFNWNLLVIDSTFNLFRGKKWNPLRNRTDSAEYDLDQLLVGTIIFTLLVFLLPTVVLYYAIFCIAMMTIMCLQIIGRLLLAFLNHFPLFALMLRIKDSQRLSDGIYFKRCHPAAFKSRWSHPNLTTSDRIFYFYLKNQPIPFNQIFYQYGYIYEQFKKYYFNRQSIYSILTGARIQNDVQFQYPTMRSNK